MLVLTRRAGEKIRISDDIWVHVVQTVGGRVLLGIEAPRDVPVYRQELLPAGRGKPATTPAPSGDVPA